MKVTFVQTGKNGETESALATAFEMPMAPQLGERVRVPDDSENEREFIVVKVAYVLPFVKGDPVRAVVYVNDKSLGDLLNELVGVEGKNFEEKSLVKVGADFGSKAHECGVTA